MAPTQAFQESPRSTRLAGNDNETIVDALDTEAHRLAGNDNETIAAEERDVEGNSLTRNDNETVVDDEPDTQGHIRFRDPESNLETTATNLRRIEPDERDEDSMDPTKARRLARR